MAFHWEALKGSNTRIRFNQRNNKYTRINWELTNEKGSKPYLPSQWAQKPHGDADYQLEIL